MKKFICLISFMLMAALAHAEPVKWIDFKQFPDVKTGVAYSLENFSINHTETVEIATWKALSLNAGYAGDGDSVDHKFIGTLSVDLLKVGDFIKFPILDKVIIQPFGWFGVGKIDFKNMMEDSETDAGVGVYIAQVRF